MSNKLRYASPVKRLSKINLLCKQKSSRIKIKNGPLQRQSFKLGSLNLLEASNITWSLEDVYSPK